MPCMSVERFKQIILNFGLGKNTKGHKPSGLGLLWSGRQTKIL